jgi:hypothetical protein
MAVVLTILGLAQERSRKTSSVSLESKDQVTIQSVKPNPVMLEAGGLVVTVTISGTNLDQITAIRVVEQGKLTTPFEAKLGPASAASRTVELKAKAEAAAGRYRLRIITPSQRIDIPEAVVSLEVRMGSAGPVTGRQKALPAPAQPTTGPAAKASRSSAPPKPPTRRLSTANVGPLISEIFSGARLAAEACGGRDSERKTTVNVPNAFFKQEPLPRLDYELTEGEKNRCERGRYRRSKIRACVDDWNTKAWTGAVEAGKFKIALSFTSILVIRIRAIDEDLDAGLGVSWKDSPGDWSDPKADENMNDYRLSGTLDVFLTPALDSGVVTYSGIDVRWNFYEPLTGWVPYPGTSGRNTPHHTICREIEEPKYLNYKDSVLETIRQRIVALFSDGQVRARLSEALTQFVKSGDFADREIAEVTGKGESVSVQFR